MPIDSSVRNKNYVGDQLYVIGWGKTMEGGSTSDILLQIQLPVLDNEICKDRYRKIGSLVSEKQFSDLVLCAGVLTGGQDSCQGNF